MKQVFPIFLKPGGAPVPRDLPSDIDPLSEAD